MIKFKSFLSSSWFGAAPTVDSGSPPFWRNGRVARINYLIFLAERTLQSRWSTLPLILQVLRTHRKLKFREAWQGFGAGIINARYLNLTHTSGFWRRQVFLWFSSRHFVATASTRNVYPRANRRGSLDLRVFRTVSPPETGEEVRTWDFQESFSAGTGEEVWT